MSSLSMKIGVATVLLIVPVTIVAHHNAASHYLTDQSITVRGVVTEFV